jgi:hypothetical protein
MALKLTGTKTYKNGVVMVKYRRADAMTVHAKQAAPRKARTKK